jgi:CRP/FNR family transcriptional regulator, anaerobic regulatory protein
MPMPTACWSLRKSSTDRRMANATDSPVAEHPLLRTLPAAVLAQLAAQPVTELPGGTRVFETSSPCGGFPILLSGTVRVFKQLANGRRIELYRVTPDQPCILSLGCMLGGGRYPAGGVTYGPTRMIVMPPGLFNQCLANDEAFRTAIFRALGDRLINTMELVEEIATLRLDVRLAGALLAHHAAQGGEQIAVTHQDLADELGTVREMVSRVLDDFAQQGLVEPGRGRLRIVDTARLRRLADTR